MYAAPMNDPKQRRQEARDKLTGNTARVRAALDATAGPEADQLTSREATLADSLTDQVCRTIRDYTGTGSTATESVRTAKTRRAMERRIASQLLSGRRATAAPEDAA